MQVPAPLHVRPVGGDVLWAGGVQGIRLQELALGADQVDVALRQTLLWYSAYMCAAARNSHNAAPACLDR